MNKYAYVALFGSDDYLYPLIVNYCSWNNTQSKYPFLLLVSDSVSEENLKIVNNLGYKVIKVKEYIPKNYEKLLTQIKDGDALWDWHGKTKADKGWRHAFSKIEAYNLTDYDKVLFIDADVMWFHNMDDIFEYPTMSSVNWQYDQFCSGFMLIEPKHDLYLEIKEYFDNYIPKKNEPSLYDDYLVYQSYYKKNWNKLPNYYFYNSIWLHKCNNAYLFDNYAQIRCIHTTGGEKPWIQGKNNVINYTSEWKPYVDFWNFYIDFLNHCIDIYNLPLLKITW